MPRCARGHTLTGSRSASPRPQIPGGSTFCILSFNGRTRQLACSNIGDSAFLVVRPAKAAGRATGATIIYQSVTQLHYFNCPTQVRGHALP